MACLNEKCVKILSTCKNNFKNRLKHKGKTVYPLFFGEWVITIAGYWIFELILTATVYVHMNVY